MTSIFSHTSEGYSAYIQERLGKGRQHAVLVYKEWFRTGKVTGNDPAFNNARKLFEEILSITDFSYLPIKVQSGEGETKKYLLSTVDGLEIEMVALPMKAGWTLCVSSQVGCRMGCAFCETGKMGLLRNLSVEEILSQVFQARHTLGISVRNLVFMGMGEPLDNYEALFKSIQILTDMNGFGLGPSRITVSTSGLVDKIYRLAEEADPALNLAVSVNAPNNSIRSRLMPVNQRFDMLALRQAMDAYCSHPRRKILVEYVLIKGKTDRREDALELAAYLRGLRVSVNLIPYNPQSRNCFESPDASSIRLFVKVMKEEGYSVFVRGTKGQKIMAACGQLGNREWLRKRRIGSMLTRSI